MMMMGFGWIGSIGVININEQAVKRADAKIMDALYTHTSKLESQGLSSYYLHLHYLQSNTSYAHTWELKQYSTHF